MIGRMPVVENCFVGKVHLSIKGANPTAMCGVHLRLESSQPSSPIESTYGHSYRQGFTQAILGLSIFLGALLGEVSPLAAQEIRVTSERRWLEVQQIQGDVTYRGNQKRPARVGDRLGAVGQGISTASRSTSILNVDTGIGVVKVAENTALSVNRLSIMADGARVTILDIAYGQARLQVRPFTNPNTRLEIRTPSGIAGVRGTDFGVSVDPVGKSGVATLAGAVEASAQGQAVMVNPGFVSVIIPGEPPTPPRPIDRELRLRIRDWRRISGKVAFLADVDPSNSVLLNGQEVAVSRNGRVDVRVSLPVNQSYLRVVVRNPLGEERRYRVRVREIDGR